MSAAALGLTACGDGEEQSVRAELQAAHDAINRMIDRVEQGETEEAEEAFESIHGALHRIEAEVSRVDVPLAQAFSGLVIDVEEELAGQRNASRLADLAREMLRQIESAAETLGLGPLGDR